MKRGEKKARWFIRKWTALGGGFGFEIGPDGNEVLGLIPPAPDTLAYRDARTLALFGFAYPHCYRVAAQIVREEGLAA